MKAFHEQFNNFACVQLVIMKYEILSGSYIAQVSVSIQMLTNKNINMCDMKSRSHILLSGSDIT